MNTQKAKTRIRYLHKKYQKQLADNWKKYNLIEYYLPVLAKNVKNENVDCFDNKLLYQSDSMKMSKKRTFGYIQSIKQSHSRNFIFDNVSQMEIYISKLARIVYLLHNEKILHTGVQEDNVRILKLSQIVIDSIDRDEMIDKLIEEKLRSIFYGNPIDVFVKDKCKLGFRTTFKDKYQNEMNLYTQVVALRNIIVHNDSRIDRKFLQETKKSLALRTKIKVDINYLQGVTILLSGIIAVSAKLICENILNDPSNGEVLEDVKKFDRAIKNKSLETLLDIF